MDHIHYFKELLESITVFNKIDLLIFLIENDSDF